MGWGLSAQGGDIGAHPGKVRRPQAGGGLGRAFWKEKEAWAGGGWWECQARGGSEFARVAARGVLWGLGWSLDFGLCASGGGMV